MSFFGNITLQEIDEHGKPVGPEQQSVLNASPLPVGSKLFFRGVWYDVAGGYPTDDKDTQGRLTPRIIIRRGDPPDPPDPPDRSEKRVRAISSTSRPGSVVPLTRGGQATVQARRPALVALVADDVQLPGPKTIEAVGHPEFTPEHAAELEQEAVPRPIGLSGLEKAETAPEPKRVRAFELVEGKGPDQKSTITELTPDQQVQFVRAILSTRRTQVSDEATPERPRTRSRRALWSVLASIVVAATVATIAISRRHSAPTAAALAPPVAAKPTPKTAEPPPPPPAPASTATMAPDPEPAAMEPTTAPVSSRKHRQHKSTAPREPPKTREVDLRGDGPVNPFQ